MTQGITINVSTVRTAGSGIYCLRVRRQSGRHERYEDKLIIKWYCVAIIRGLHTQTSTKQIAHLTTWWLTTMQTTNRSSSYSMNGKSLQHVSTAYESISTKEHTPMTQVSSRHAYGPNVIDSQLKEQSSTSSTRFVDLYRASTVMSSVEACSPQGHEGRIPMRQM